MFSICAEAITLASNLLLLAVGMKKINFSGGEPFIKDSGRYVGELVRYSKEDLGLPSVTIVSNGSLITEEWFIEYGNKLQACLHDLCIHINNLPLPGTSYMLVAATVG